MELNNNLEERKIYWKVDTFIQKFNTNEDFNKGVPNEVQHIKGNMLLNDGINTIWNLVAGKSGDSSDSDPLKKMLPFNAANSFIGVGNNGGGTTAPLPTDQSLKGPLKMYMKMDEGYPIAGENQKIIFKSTFLPGVACFDWLEWSIANGNGNISSGDFDQDEVRTQASGIDPIPDPIPVEGIAFSYGVTEKAIINLNRKQENMGKKYAPATWVISVELSLA